MDRVTLLVAVRFRVVRVEPAPNPQAFEQVWAELIER
jgi:hypothetical protein